MLLPFFFTNPGKIVSHNYPCILLCFSLAVKSGINFLIFHSGYHLYFT